MVSQQISFIDGLDSYWNEMWTICWPEWEGPRIGGYASINSPCVELESGGSTYAYMETIQLLEKIADGKWLAVIEMGIVHGEPWFKNGTRLIIRNEDLWAPVQLLSGTMKSRTKE